VARGVLLWARMKRLLVSMSIAFLPCVALADEGDPMEAPPPADPAATTDLLTAAPAPAAAPVAAAPAPVAAPAAPTARLVGVILSTSQALVWDGERGEYALKRVGEPLDGGRIVALQADRLVLERDGARMDVELGGAPFKPPVRKPRRMPAVIIGSMTAPAAAAPAAPQPLVAAPEAPPAVAAPAPVAVPFTPPPPAFAAPPRPRVLVTAAPAAAPPPATAPANNEEEEVEATVIPRLDLDSELGDFARLATQAAVTPAPRGGFQLAAVRPGSFISRVGLRVGDVILRVDGRPINRVEDAAAAYAWLRVTDHFTVDLIRQGQPVRLHYVIAQSSAHAAR
jgi:type II secretory pathway component PulC